MTDNAIHPVSMTLAASDGDAFASELGGSFARYGFAVIADHDLDQAMIDRALDATKTFFALPGEAKMAYHAPGTGGARGYTPYKVETAKGFAAPDLKEFWHRGRDLPPGHRFERFMRTNMGVAEVEDFDAAIKALFDDLDGLGAQILRSIARYLGLVDDWFEQTVNEGNSVLRLLHYPPMPPSPGECVRAGAHEDINVITLLLGAEEAGLQVKAKCGNWLSISPPPGCLVVNIGDMLQMLTNHVLPSTTHRVINPASERASHARYSTPYFLHFNPDFLIKTLPGCISAGNPDRYPEPITADGYLQQRLKEIKLK